MLGTAARYLSVGLAVGILAWLYSLYTLYAGLTPMLGVPDERRLYAFAVILVALVAIWAGRGMLMTTAAAWGGPLSAVYAAPR